ncbi:hypothetical protein NQD34_001663 [Periophthalmus magnuspinnatus]|nr:hypothetical protein NQD34_001663 [Periophthalmus magnuspinnatus]
MELFLKITPTLLLLVFTFHPVLVQELAETTITPRRTMPQSWLREKVPLKNLDPNPPVNDWPTSGEQTPEESGVESGNDMSGGTPSGSMYIMEPENMNDTMEYTTQPPTLLNETNLAQENQDTNVSTTTELPTTNEHITTVNMDNSTAVPEIVDVVPQNSTINSNGTDVQTTTSAPEKNDTTTTDSGVQFSNDTEYDATTTIGVPQSTTQEPIWQESTTATPIATIPPEETTTTVLQTTTSAPVTPDRSNLSDKGAAEFDETAERGFASESEKRRRKSAWGAVLGTFVAIAVVGLVAYVILKKKHHKAFSHRKLEEEFPSDPVLRLDNIEPLDLNIGRAAYFNPALQADNIQMSSFPKH